MNELPIGFSAVDIPVGLSDFDPVSAHLFFETPLQDFTVVEGLLLLMFCFFMLYCVYRLITR